MPAGPPRPTKHLRVTKGGGNHISQPRRAAEPDTAATSTLLERGGFSTRGLRFRERGLGALSSPRQQAGFDMALILLVTPVFVKIIRKMAREAGRGFDERRHAG